MPKPRHPEPLATLKAAYLRLTKPVQIDQINDFVTYRHSAIRAVISRLRGAIVRAEGNGAEKS